jgi:AraC-like DNA-binding protein
MRAGRVTVARVRGLPRLVADEVRRVGAADRDLLTAALYHAGLAEAGRDEHRPRAKPGDLVVFDHDRPYDPAVIDARDVVVVALPGTMLGAGAGLVRRTVGRPQPCESGTRAVLAAFLSRLADHLGDLPGTAGEHLADALVCMLVTAVAETTTERAETTTERAETTTERAGATTDLFDRIRAHVLADLGDPELCVESVARRFAISPRHLHELFRRRGIAFAAWVRYERLARVRRDLRDPAMVTRTDRAIAARWGLRDAAHLSRALRREFGQTATEIRAKA